MKKSHIEYEISLQEMQAHDPAHLISFFRVLSQAKGSQLATLQGCFNIVPADGVTRQSFNDPDVRAYCRELAATPLGLAYFLHPESQSLQMLAFAIVPRIETVEVKVTARTSNLGIRCESADLVSFLTPDLAVAESLFTRAGLGKKAFEACVHHVSRQFNLKPEDWD